MTMRFLVVAAVVFALLGCDNSAKKTAIAMVGGNPERGRQKIVSYGCMACHTIPGVYGASALVGPPLTQMGARAYVGGVLQNTPSNMIHWIEDAPSINSRTAMPNLHVTEADSRDIATYLYTLR